MIGGVHGSIVPRSRRSRVRGSAEATRCSPEPRGRRACNPVIGIKKSHVSSNRRSCLPVRHRGASWPIDRKRTGLIVAFSIVGIVLGLAGPRATASEGIDKAATYAVLRERIKTEPVKGIEDPSFPVLLLTGRRHGGLLTIGVTLHDPDDPRTLEVNFADWVLSARASLLVGYARLVTEPDRPRPYSGLPADELKSTLGNEAARRREIAQIVRAGGYATSWTPFVEAYRRLIREAEPLIPPSETGHDDRAELRVVGFLAKEQGVYALIRELPIDPGDVANEVLRLAGEWLAGADESSKAGLNLFYVCDAQASAVRVHTWHALAPEFFRAWDATDKKTGDARALLIMKGFDALGKEIRAWIGAHPEADSADRDRKLNDLAKSHGLYSLLEGDAKETR